jgi:hypothetical protein
MAGTFVKYDKGVNLIPTRVVFKDITDNLRLIEGIEPLQFDFTALKAKSKIIGAIQYFELTGVRYSFAYRTKESLFLFRSKDALTTGIRAILNGESIVNSNVEYLSVDNVIQLED